LATATADIVFIAVNKHCRFIGYADEYGVKKAVNWFHGKMLHGRRIKVEETLKTAASIGKQLTGTCK